MTSSRTRDTRPPLDPATLLDDELLDVCRDRAAGLRRATTPSPHADLAELSDRGYLRAFVPVASGGLGLGLAEVAALQCRLATPRPPRRWRSTCTSSGPAARRCSVRPGRRVARPRARRRGGRRGLRVRGERARQRSRPVRLGDDGRAPTGRRVPVHRHEDLHVPLARLDAPRGLRPRRHATPDLPTLVHGFVTRDQPGHVSLGDWDTDRHAGDAEPHDASRRASRSPPSRIVRRPAGRARAPTRSSSAIFAVFETTDRGRLPRHRPPGRRPRRRGGLDDDLATLRGAVRALDPIIRWRVADAAIALDGLEPQVDAVARDVDDLVDHGADWFPRLVGLKTRATETARRVVDQAVTVAGGSSLPLVVGARSPAARRPRRPVPPVHHATRRTRRSRRSSPRAPASARWATARCDVGGTCDDP